MAKYQLTSPQGQKFEVEAPDGASEADVLDYFQKQVGQLEKPSYGSKEDIAAEAKKRVPLASSDLAAHSATMGATEYIPGYFRGGTNYLLKKARGEDADFEQEYKRERDIYKQQLEMARKDATKVPLPIVGDVPASELVGGFGGIAGKAGAATEILSNAAPQAASWGARAGNYLADTWQAVKGGAGYGAIYGFNTSDATTPFSDPLRAVGEKAIATSEGAVHGAVMAPFFKAGLDTTLGTAAKLRQAYSQRVDANRTARSERANEVQREFEEAGVPRFLPAEGGPTAQAITSTVDGSPIIGPRTREGAATTMRAVNDRTTELLNATNGNTTPANAGERIRNFAREQLLTREEMRGGGHRHEAAIADIEARRSRVDANRRQLEDQRLQLLQDSNQMSGQQRREARQTADEMLGQIQELERLSTSLFDQRNSLQRQGGRVEGLPIPELERISGLSSFEGPRVPRPEPEPIQRITPEEYLRGVGEGVPPVEPRIPTDLTSRYQPPTVQDVVLPPELVGRMQKTSEKLSSLQNQVAAAKEHIRAMDQETRAPLRDAGITDMKPGHWGGDEKAPIWNFQTADGSLITLDTAGQVIAVHKNGRLVALEDPMAHVPPEQLSLMQKAIEWGNLRGGQEQNLRKLQTEAAMAGHENRRIGIEEASYRRNALERLQRERAEEALRQAEAEARSAAAIETQRLRQEAIERERPQAVNRAAEENARREEAAYERSVDEQVRLQNEADAAHRAAMDRPFELGVTNEPIQRQLDAAYALNRANAPGAQRNILGDVLRSRTNTTRLLDEIALEARSRNELPGYKEGRVLGDDGRLQPNLAEYLRPRIGENLYERMMRYSEARATGNFTPALEGLTRLRTDFRRAAMDAEYGMPGEPRNLDATILRRMAGALDGDLRDFARSTGQRGELFIRQLDQIDAAYSRYINDMRRPLARILNQQTDVGSIYNEVARSVRNGSSNIDTLRRLYELVDRNGNDTLNRASLTGMILADMQRDGIQAFMQAYRGLSPDARALMFQGATAGLGERLDALTRVGGRMERWARDAERTDMGMRDILNAHHVGLGLLGYTSLPTVIGTALGARAADRLFNSRFYGDWLRRAPMNEGVTSAQWQRHMQRLIGYASDLLEGPEKKRALTNSVRQKLSEALLGSPAHAIFAGENAATADKDALAAAQKRLDAGEDPAKVWADTGWYQGKDGKMRFEINDKGSAITGEGAVMLRQAKRRSVSSTTTLGKVLAHEEAYKAHPELKDIRFRILAGKELSDAEKHAGGRDWGAYWDQDANEIVVNSELTDDLKDFRSMIIHEVNHAVGDYAKFDYGPRRGAYERRYGEVEARNSQKRIDMDPMQRRLSYPPSTQDVAWPHVLVTRNRNVQEQNNGR